MNTQRWMNAMAASMRILRWLGSNCDKVRDAIKFSYKMANEIVDQSEIAFGLATQTLDDPHIRQLIAVSGEVIWTSISKKMDENAFDQHFQT